MNRLLPSLLLAAAWLGGSFSVRAQMSPDLIMETYNANIQVITDGAINKSVMDKAFERRDAAAKGTSAKTATAKTRPTTTPASLTYTPTPALKRQTVQGYVDRLQVNNPAAAKAVTEQLGPGKYDYGQIYAGLTKDSGLPANNAAASMATYMIIGWMIVNNVQDGNAITIPMARGVQAQVTELLAGNAQLGQPGVAAQLGEELKLQTVIVQGGWQSALKEGKGNLAAYQKGIAGLFQQQYGLDLAAFDLTADGFAKK